MNPETRFRKSTLRSAVLLAMGINGVLMGAGNTQAASEVCIGSNSTTPTSTSTDSANFTMLSSGGGVVGGTNDVTLIWNGRVFDNSTDYTGPGSVANVTASSTAPFFGYTWTAHDIQVFLPGTYSFDTSLQTVSSPNGSNNESGMMNVTVPSGMLGMHMLFNWNGNNNIDVFVVVAPDSVFGSGLLYSTVTNSKGQFKCDSNFAGTVVTNCLFDNPLYGSAGAPTKNQSWMLASVDGNSDGVMGIPMQAGGPFAGFNANFNLRGTFSGQTLQNTCATFVDTIPDAFSFAAVTDAVPGATYESNSITVSGLASGVSASISIADGWYSVSTDGGTTWSPYSTTTPGTVQNNHMVKVRGFAPSANNQTTSVVLTIGGIAGTFSISTPVVAGTQGSNFTMLDPTGGVVGGTNDVVANWDGTFDTNVASMVFNRMTLSSITPFFQFPWTAHHIRVFGPGSYQIDTTCTVADLEAGISNCNRPLESGQTQRYLSFTVGANQYAAHMLFDWNTSTNIDVVNVWNQDEKFGPSTMHTGDGACNDPNTVWDLMSMDPDGDGQNGMAMIDGPFKGFKANFNIRLPGSVILPCSAYTPTVNVDNPSGAKGCSISASPVNALQRGDWLLVTGFLAWLGAVRKRFKRQVQS